MILQRGSKAPGVKSGLSNSTGISMNLRFWVHDNPEWERLHRAFHALLIGGCGSKPLIGFCEQLADRLYRYRALSIRKAFRARKVSDEHATILKAALDRDTAAAERLPQLHHEKTADIIRADLGCTPATQSDG